MHSLLSFPKNFTTGAFVYTSKKRKTIATQLSITLYKRFATLSQIREKQSFCVQKIFDFYAFSNLKRGEFLKN